MTLKFYLIAGEASGDLLGAGLMRELKKIYAGEDMFIYGVGGEKMETEGLKSLFPYHELSLMGFAEIIPHITTLMGRINGVIEDVQNKHPDVVITIDSPGFNSRIVKKMRKLPEFKNTVFIHYVAPTVWAYKPERAKKCAALFDHMLVLLPFEPPYFTAEGLDTTFVGHPVAYQKKEGDGAYFREKYNLDENATLLTLMPGSRENEIRRHMPVFGPAITELSQIVPNLAMVVPVHKRLLPILAGYFEHCPFRAILLAEEEDKFHALAASQFALVKSGTVSLEVARSRVPQIVTYKANPISAWIVKRMIKVKFVNLINILCEREVIPEFLQERCTSSLLKNALERLIKDPKVREQQLAGVEEAFRRLHAPGDADPSQLAAETIKRVVGSKREEKQAA